MVGFTPAQLAAESQGWPIFTENTVLLWVSLQFEILEREESRRLDRVTERVNERGHWLTAQISGPDQPNLSVIDLPGLVGGPNGEDAQGTLSSLISYSHTAKYCARR